MRSNLEEIYKVSKVSMTVETRKASSFLDMIDEEWESSSSSGKTEQFVAFSRLFRSEFRRMLRDAAKRITFNVGHFEVSGFVETLHGQIWYFSTGDLRFGAKHYGFLLRTAKDFKDFMGGPNQRIDYGPGFAERLVALVSGA